LKRVVPLAFSTLVLVATAAFSAGTPKLIYTKTFPKSSPEYMRLAIDSSGNLEYSELPKDDHPLSARIAQSEAASLFDIAGKLDNFKTPLESGLKVANTGKKVFRYEDGNGGSSEAAFNYSLNPMAQQLLEKFEEIASSERAYLDLDRTVRFDKLGVNDALAEVEALWERKQLAAPAQFIPLLTRVSTHDSFMHLARDRAARLKDEFERPPVAPAGDSKQK
jgi:hypothetical protein